MILQSDPPNPFVSRGGLKLDVALTAFSLDVSGFHCADLGCNVGGFTDCLLQRGAAKVFAVDTGYGTLAWKLRKDDRVIVMERTNAMHLWDKPAEQLPTQPIDLVVIDLAWTPQRHAIPAAMRWQPRHIISLIKPHYEAADDRLVGGVLPPESAGAVLQDVLAAIPQLGVEVAGHIPSPIQGGGGKKRKGNIEYLAYLKPVSPS